MSCMVCGVALHHDRDAFLSECNIEMNGPHFRRADERRGVAGAIDVDVREGDRIDVFLSGEIVGCAEAHAAGA